MWLVIPGPEPTRPHSLWRPTARTPGISGLGLTLDPLTLNLQSRFRVMSSCTFGADFTLAPFGGQLPTFSHPAQPATGIGRHADVDVGHLGPRRRLEHRQRGRAPSPPPGWAARGGPPVRCGGGAPHRGRSSRPTRSRRRRTPRARPPTRAPSRGAIVPPTPVTIFAPSSWGRPTGGSATVSSTRPLPSTTALPVGPSTHATGRRSCTVTRTVSGHSRLTVARRTYGSASSRAPTAARCRATAWRRRGGSRRPARPRPR